MQRKKNKTNMQTILGAGGDIGRLLAKELKKYTSHLRLVSRNPSQVNGDDELLAADLTNKEQVILAVEGADVVYLTVGLSYDYRVWEKQWPVIMENVLEACLHHGSKLVFFDNVYLYDKHYLSDMTEDSPVNPPSRKGVVRARLVQMIEESGTRGLPYLIARSADFYGPGASKGILNMLVTDNMMRGKKANWQTDPDKIHSFTYTPDAARAVALLGNTPSAFQQTWHLPTSTEKLTGRQFVALAAHLAGKKPSFFVLTPWMMKIAGLFSTQIGELVEMQYQNDRDYFFNSAKFTEAFPFVSTPYETGLRETLTYTQ